MRRAAVFILALLLLATNAAAQNRRGPQQPPAEETGGRTIDPFSLPHYSTKYYELYTDLGIDEAREVALHISKMAEVYAERTRGFSGAIRQKFPFVLFKSREDYELGGGPPGTAGFYNGRILQAVAGKELDARTWHVIQHEGFHQFAAGVIRGDLPTWVNEGLAEYFGEGLYTGDDIITGVVPAWRLKRIKKHLESNDFKPVDEIMNISLSDWNREMDVTNYDQAWSMVEFLAHGDGGRYQSNLIAYMNALARGKNHTEAWRAAFPDSRGFETRWREYWLALPEDTSDPLRAKATVSTLTSFLARASIAGQTFESFDAFVAAANGKTVLTPGEDDLPPSLLADAMKDAAKREKAGAKFSLVRATTADKANQNLQSQLVMETGDGRKLVGKFTLRNGKVMRVTVDFSGPAKKS